MPIYIFQHPDTEETFEEIRPFSRIDEPFYAPDGKECKRILSAFTVIDKNAEVWKKDPSYVKHLNPKWIKTRSGQKIRYDPTKHC